MASPEAPRASYLLSTKTTWSQGLSGQHLPVPVPTRPCRAQLLQAVPAVPRPARGSGQVGTSRVKGTGTGEQPSPGASAPSPLTRGRAALGGDGGAFPRAAPSGAQGQPRPRPAGSSGRPGRAGLRPRARAGARGSPASPSARLPPLGGRSTVTGGVPWVAEDGSLVEGPHAREM